MLGAVLGTCSPRTQCPPIISEPLSRRYPLAERSELLDTIPQVPGLGERVRPASLLEEIKWIGFQEHQFGYSVRQPRPSFMATEPPKE
jgi:hypothetical protein